MKFSKNTLRKTVRTFIQTALGYLAVNIAVVDFSAEKAVIKSALLGVAVSAVSAGFCAVMNLEKKENGSDI
ncbi:MAG: hypothetical protein ACI4RR_06675 [Eubacterium sp.]